MKKNNLASLISIIVGILILIHHLIYTSRLFDMEDVLHHEFFAGVFIAFGVGAFLFRTKK
jgi:predicted membrane protein